MPDRSRVRFQTKRERHPGPPGWGLGIGLTSQCHKELVEKTIQLSSQPNGCLGIRHGQEQINEKDYTLFYSGPKSGTGQLGTDFMISTKTKKYLIGFEPIMTDFVK
jgi:acyl CoA:acetate/3-ketoacid CoA transferase beta subunit